MAVAAQVDNWHFAKQWRTSVPYDSLRTENAGPVQCTCHGIRAGDKNNMPLSELIILTASHKDGKKIFLNMEVINSPISEIIPLEEASTTKRKRHHICWSDIVSTVTGHGFPLPCSSSCSWVRAVFSLLGDEKYGLIYWQFAWWRGACLNRACWLGDEPNPCHI